ncbi:MAG: AAA family ATPase [Cytophagales bacterium]|nr:AAA family ATPase [Cytophagales bacterium]
MSLKQLNDKSKEFDLPKDNIDKRENDRQSFVSKFPIDTIKDLSIDEYVQGTDENSFCYWLEFKNILFGIGGGNASKFGIYKAKDGKYYTSYGKNKRELTGQELKDSFNQIKAGIIQALKYTKNDQIDKIKTINLPLWNMVLQKILSIYYPDKFITIGSPDVLIECARDIRIKGVELKPENSIEINYECKKALTSLPEYSDWTYEKIGSFIWQTYLDDSKRDYYILGSKYGEHADQDVFPEMLEKQVIVTGFASQLNLEEYYLKNHSEITEYLSEQGEDRKSYNALKYFLTLKVGDRVAIKADGSPKGKKGFLSIVGIAEIIEKDGEIYRHDPNGLGHLINVKFIKAPVYKEFDLGGYGRTIHKLSKPDHIDLIFKSEYSPVPIEDLYNIPKEVRVIYAYLKNSLSHRKIQSEVLGEDAPARGGGFLAMQILHEYEIEGDKKGVLNKTPFHIEYEKAEGKYLEALNLLKKYYPEFVEGTEKNNKMRFPLNTILYGPPGTGKTYNTVLRAAEIIENRKIDSYDEALEIFKANLHEQIEFITFHQNFSYEDFIQGLRPDTENDKELTFERKDGVFKVIADKALKNISASEQPPVAKKTFEETFNEFVYPLVEGEVEEIEVKMKKVSYFITAITNKSIEFRKTSGGTEHTLSISTLRKMYDAESVLDIQGLSSYYSPLLDELLRIGKDSTGKKEIIQRKNYVIIIDEINRANISRVFGELITLIEPDKRSHGKIPMEAKLPSGDTFIVPSNLYIIGTMNTADKSIALLDIALRRRFEFEPMYPKYSEDGINVNDEDILKSINESIISDKGHDFQIGHSYFMDSKEDPYDFKRRMNVKVIPLLLEYFMNDAKTVAQIVSKALSNAQYNIDEKSWPLRITENND